MFRKNSTTGRNAFYKLTRHDSHIKVAEYTDSFFSGNQNISLAARFKKKNVDPFININQFYTKVLCIQQLYINSLPL